VYSFFEQYSEVTLDNEKIKRINDFIKQARAKNFLDSKNEFLLYCSQCRKVVLTNKLEEDDKCTCGMSYDFKFSLTSISPSISQEIISGHLLELYALRIARSIEDLKLIGMEIQGEEKVVYTSIQYSDIGVGDKSNGELDLLGVKNDTIAAFECKFNETTYSDIKDFLGIADNLYYRIREKKPNLKLIKIIISYDGSKLTPSNNFFVMSIKNLISINTAIKEIKTLIH
jgi:Holliday junction resolvase